MAIALLTWELGGGMGHLVNLLPLARGLRQRGHRVYAAVQDLGKAGRAFHGLDIEYLQAPTKIQNLPGAIEPPRTFAHILHNRGFGDLSELRAIAGAWRNLLEMVRPDLIVFDHSPTALLAARGHAAKKALIGTGFFCPLDEYPMADLRPWLAEERASEAKSSRGGEGETGRPGDARIKEDEDRSLANANAVLAGWGQPPLERLARLFHDVDEHFLATLPELDHYAGRRGAGSAGQNMSSPWPEYGRGDRAGGRQAGSAGQDMPSPWPSPEYGRGDSAGGRQAGSAGQDMPSPWPSPEYGRGDQTALTPCPSPILPSTAGGRGETKYWGAWPNIGGKPPAWPDGPAPAATYPPPLLSSVFTSSERRRIFAYLKPFPALPRVLGQLCDLRCPTIVHGDGLDDGIRRRFQSPTMRFEEQPVDLREARRSCDLAILNGNHGTTLSMLLAGKPTLQIPISLEQALFSRAVQRLGAAVIAPPDAPKAAVGALMLMLGSGSYAEAARRFADRYADYDPRRQMAAVCRRAEELLR